MGCGGGSPRCRCCWTIRRRRTRCAIGWRRLIAAQAPDAEVEGPRQRSLQIEKMLGAFQLNLTAMSLVSLLVGTFLIYNTMFASAARRRVEVGILRSIGVTRAEVRALFLCEALIFGVLGIVAGIAGGAAAGGRADGLGGADGLVALRAHQHRAAGLGGAAVCVRGGARHRLGARRRLGSGR